ncbi:MAG TPA: alpha/beta hydrolase [Solirubrobacterales bacterium]|nr:alpha/beta hydrolase [Solirubrobacterales bacterium]
MAVSAPLQFAVGPAPVIRGEVAGEGTPIVLCHGVTATRRYVVQGSRVLERSGFRVLSYDARGHGESDPAPAGESYEYPLLVDDLERVVAAELGEGQFFLAGHSMGAHTAVAYALRHPDRLAGLIIVGPVFTGETSPMTLAYWDGLADALEAGGVDGFVDYIAANQGIATEWSETVLRFTRERILLHEHPEALAEALRSMPRSRPFESLEDLRGLEVPALVVASHDAADPGHPYEVAAAYAAALPQARLVSEGDDESPLAWQGGKLSREIVAFCGEHPDSGS